MHQSALTSSNTRSKIYVQINDSTYINPESETLLLQSN